MTTTVKKPLDQLLALEDDDRVELADRLYEPLGPSTDQKYRLLEAATEVKDG